MAGSDGVFGLGFGDVWKGFGRAGAWCFGGGGLVWRLSCCSCDSVVAVDLREGANVEVSSHIEPLAGAENECGNLGLWPSLAWSLSRIKLSTSASKTSPLRLLPSTFPDDDMAELIIFVSEVMLISKHKKEKETDQTTFFFR